MKVEKHTITDGPVFRLTAFGGWSLNTMHGCVDHVDETFHHVLDVWLWPQPRVVVKEIADDKTEYESCEGRVQAYCSPKQAKHAAKTRAAQCKTDHRCIVQAPCQAP
jgi:hypothetical protein